MVNMKNLVTDISEVPEAWIYKYYYEKYSTLDPPGNIIIQPFDGRIIKTRSLKNNDSNPSLCFYFKNGKYYWNDFSSGQGGDAIWFVSHILNKTYPAASICIIIEYEKFLENGGIFDSIDLNSVKVNKPSYQLIIEKFSIVALDWWNLPKISLSTLNRFKVKELKNYNVIKGNQSYTYGGFCFGFFSSSGAYQLYSPLTQRNKYININTDYLIGSDQLEFKSNTCIIKSGLKDIMAIIDLNLDAEYVASSSETSILSIHKINFLRSHYKNILCMLDNDAAGIKAMKRYEKVYGIKSVHIQLEKDTAENTRHYSPDYLRGVYSFEINKKLNE